ncbi:MAG: phosphatase PAP2 family protein [Muribaculaceae bacterium]|nr:phosphatase PAP2 family protein [Muribaculaceae bacterium]
MKKSLYFCIILPLLLMPVRLMGQERADSADVCRGTQSTASLVGTSVAAGLLIGEGGITRAAMFPLGDISNLSARNSTAVDILQFVPVTFSWIAKACGVKTRSSWGRMAVSQAFGGLLEEGIVWTSKKVIKAQRPGRSGKNSFPSGHTARAFFGATAGAIEYGESMPELALAGYAFALGVGTQRAMSNMHLPADVVAGAGVGILAAEAGYLLGDLIFGKGRPHGSAGDYDACDRFRLSVATGLDFPTTKTIVGGTKIGRWAALRSSVDGQLFFSNHWGLIVSCFMQAMPLSIGDIYAGSLNSISLGVGPMYRLPFAGGMSLDFVLQGAYGLHLNRNLCEAFMAKRALWEGRAMAEFTYPLTRRLACRASVGYAVAGSTYCLLPSSNFGIVAPAEANVLTGSVTTSIAAVVSF